MKINVYPLLMSIVVHHGVICSPTAPVYGIKLVGSAFQTYLRVSWMTCIRHCQAIRQCQWVNYYFRMTGTCELFAAPDDTLPQIQPHEGVWHSSKSGWEYDQPAYCQSCSDDQMCNSDSARKCKTVTCGNLVPLPGARILGNRNNEGAQRLFICRNREKRVTTCLEDGSWSITTKIMCECTMPSVKNARLDIAKSGIEATIVCDDGYTIIGSNKISCDESTKDWTSVENINCIKYRDGVWTLVYGKNHGVYESIYQSWTGEIGNGDYRNDDFLSNWEDRNAVQVKVQIIDFTDNVVKTLIFDGDNTDVWSWFSQSKLLESSWTDLTATSPSVDVFSISGIGTYVEEPREALVDKHIPLRWTILNYNIDSSNNKSINCSNNKMWFAIMHASVHPCGDVVQNKGVEGHIIVYSDTTTGSRWNDGHWTLAKMMLIYAKN